MDGIRKECLRLERESEGTQGYPDSIERIGNVLQGCHRMLQTREAGLLHLVPVGLAPLALRGSRFAQITLLLHGFTG